MTLLGPFWFTPLDFVQFFLKCLGFASVEQRDRQKNKDTDASVTPKSGRNYLEMLSNPQFSIHCLHCFDEILHLQWERSWFHDCSVTHGIFFQCTSIHNAVSGSQTKFVMCQCCSSTLREIIVLKQKEKEK